jgi:Protein of unknown function (DUF2384)
MPYKHGKNPDIRTALMAIAKKSRATTKSAAAKSPAAKTPAAKPVRLKTAARAGSAAAAAPPAPSSAGRLILKFFDAHGNISVERIAKGFGMSKGQLAETIGLRPETVYRAARLQAPRTQARATEMLEIIGRIADWAGGEKQAMAWYRAEPIAAFGGRTAEALVKEGKATAVRDYLDSVATGGFA